MWGAVFPGQGSQHVGMGKFLFDNFVEAKHLFEEASDTLNQNFKRLCFEGPETDLTLTENTQPALLLNSTALFLTLQKNTAWKPLLAAGHSLGEYSALVAAGALEFSEALKAVKTRGQAMQNACPLGEGGMAAVLGLESSEVETLCSWTEKQSGFGPLRPANFNAPGQIVISGKMQAIDWLKSNYSPEASGLGKRLKMIPLNVSAPFHSPLMKPAQDVMAQVLRNLNWKSPRFPIIQNTTAHESQDVECLRSELTNQISAPVRWVQSVTRMKELGITSLVEVGPGKVLAGLVKKIDSDGIQTFNINSLEELRAFEDNNRK